MLPRELSPITSLQAGTVGVGRSVGGSIGWSVGRLAGQQAGRQVGKYVVLAGRARVRNGHR